jgi:hypothetical protein
MALSLLALYLYSCITSYLRSFVQTFLVLYGHGCLMLLCVSVSLLHNGKILPRNSVQVSCHLNFVFFLAILNTIIVARYVVFMPDLRKSIRLQLMSIKFKMAH